VGRDTDDVKPRVERKETTRGVDLVLLVTVEVLIDRTLAVDVEGSADVEDLESVSVAADVTLSMVNALTDGTLTVGENVGEVED